MSVSRRGWSIYAILYVCVHLTRGRDISVFVINPGVHDLKAIGTEEIEDAFGFMGKKLIPIKEPRASKILAPPLEPDAEMLPAHYEGVKPPGVDHMELKYAETKDAKVSVDQSNDQSAKLNKKKGNVKTEHEKVVSVEKGQKGEDVTQKKKTEHVEGGGEKRVKDARGGSSKQYAEEGKSEDGASHKVKSNDKVDRVATGYRNVYHKDEYNKNHDFYDNDDHGGHTKHHGRYNERHVATEGSFKNGKSNFEVAEHYKPETQKLKVVPVEGHGFLENFQGYVRQKG
ncbi:uncharacterized protein LOC105663118 [Megachile rotundata]|uniref:uncharacterized protein LOC105663118 n=1 Tax=Megachile rotundata TaxID=143995 RepID=UPI003FCF428A